MFPGFVSIIVSGFCVTMPAHVERNVSCVRQHKKQPAAKTATRPNRCEENAAQHHCRTTTNRTDPLAYVCRYGSTAPRACHSCGLQEQRRQGPLNASASWGPLGLQVACSATLQIGALPAEQATAPLCTERLPEPPARALLPVASACRSWQAAIRIAYVPVTETALPVRSWD